MPDSRQTNRKLALLTSGETLVGLCFLVSGLILVWNGVDKLRQLYGQFSVYFPLSLPDNVAHILLQSLPTILTAFIHTIGSICAVVLGVMWAVVGIVETTEAGKRKAEALDFEHPGVVAESLRTGQSLQWRTRSWVVRILARLVARARLLSPVSYDIFHRVFGSLVKLLLIWVVVGIVFYCVHILPALLLKYFGVQITLAVPRPDPLYYLLTMLIVANVLIALSLVPIRKPTFVRESATVAVRGTGDPHLFFALLEEGCQLLSTGGRAIRRPRRLEQEGNALIRGTLIESFPENIASFSRPAGYVCLLFVPTCLVLGFSRLINFYQPPSPVYYTQFLSLQFPEYILEVLFALGLILAGTHFGEWARTLLTILRFRSALVFCHTGMDYSTGSRSATPSPISRHALQSSPLRWATVEKIDQGFAQWAKDPRSLREFRAEIFWAEIISESASADNKRVLVNMRRSETVDDSMRRLIRLPFHVGFESIPQEASESSPLAPLSQNRPLEKESQ